MSTRTLSRRRDTRRRAEGDIHVGSGGGDVRPTPGSTTAAGQRAIDEIVRELLDEVRHHVRERARS